jgi:4-hydroxy-3-methylbut-2-enyl diphosphate reductase
VDESELQAFWFSASDSVGVCGATSTPKWLLEKVAEKLKELQ